MLTPFSAAVWHIHLSGLERFPVSKKRLWITTRYTCKWLCLLINIWNRFHCRFEILDKTRWRLSVYFVSDVLLGVVTVDDAHFQFKWSSPHTSDGPDGVGCIISCENRQHTVRQSVSHSPLFMYIALSSNCWYPFKPGSATIAAYKSSLNMPVSQKYCLKKIDDQFQWDVWRDM